MDVVLVSGSLIAVMLVTGSATAAHSQRREGARTGAASAGAATPQVERGAVERRVRIDVTDVRLEAVLREIAKQSGVPLLYSEYVVPVDRRVTVKVRDVSALEATRVALRGTRVRVRMAATGQILLERSAAEDPLIRDPEPAAAGTLTGRVTDARLGLGLASAAVVVEGTRWSATTDEDGRYRISGLTAGRYVVSARRLGFTRAVQMLALANGQDTTLDFTLTAVPSQLEQVVTTVTGSQRMLEMGNVVGTIQSAAVTAEAPVMSLTDVLNGRVAGAQVILNGGFTGTSPRIRIRGVNSPTVSNDPLVLVDGVRVENTSGGSVLGFGQTSGRLNDINPEEIESIEIVKGPSAATLYGTDAANGVIVVHTKRGHAGRPRVDVYGESGVLDVPVGFADNFYSWGRNTATRAVQQCLLLQKAAGTCAVDSLSRFNPLASAATSPIGSGGRTQLGAQLSGGAPQVAYFVAAEREQETGVLRMPDNERRRIEPERGGTPIPDEQLRPNALTRMSVRGNASAAIGERGEVRLSSGFVRSGIWLPGNGVFNAGYRGPGFRDANDGWSGTRPGEAFAVRNKEDVSHFTSSVSSDWQVKSWLTGRATAGVDFSSDFLDVLQRRGEGPLGTNRNGRRLNTRTDAQLYSADVGASAVFAASEHVTARTSIGVQFNRRQLSTTSASGTGLSPGAATMAGAAVVTASEQNTESIVTGSYLEESIGIAQRWFLNGALRVDGGSSFGRDFRAAIYPKASISWLALKRAGDAFVTSLRVRTAYGASGVQPGSTAALPLETVFGALLNGSATPAAALSAIGNRALRPERQSELEGGADIELLHGRVRLEATVYDRRSDDALIDRPLPASVGIATRQENLGSVRNLGVEGQLAVRVFDRRRISWDIDVGGSANRNRLERMGAGITTFGARTALVKEGYPLFGRWDRPILGYRDDNGNGVIEAREIQVGDSLVFVGPPLPVRLFSATTEIGLFDRRLRISALFDARGGHRQINVNEVNRCGFFGNCRGVNDSAAPPGEQARAVVANTPSLGSSWYGYLEDGSFIRWRELSVTYTLPPRLAARIRARNALVTIAGRNLHLWSDYSGIDPETQSQPGVGEGYGENPTAPQTRYLILRLSLGL